MVLNKWPLVVRAQQSGIVVTLSWIGATVSSCSFKTFKSIEFSFVPPDCIAHGERAGFRLRLKAALHQAAHSFFYFAALTPLSLASPVL